MANNPLWPIFAVGSWVRVTVTIAGMPAGSEGIFVRTVESDHAIVSFWDGGPLRVPLAVLEIVYPV